jgi:hypothetical protein
MEHELPRRQPLAMLMEAGRSSRGIVTAAQAHEIGIDCKQLQRLVATGALIREAWGIYRPVGVRVGLAERALIATTRVAGVVSHQTAARLWGCRGAGFDDELVHLTVSRGARPRPMPGLVVHTTRRTLEGLATTRGGVAVTRPMRTVLDVSSQELDDERLQSVVDYFVVERLVTIRSLERFLSSKGRGIPGLARLRHLVAEVCVVDSVAEAELLRVLVAAGIETPVTQFVVRDAGGHFLGRVDKAWPAAKVALELDGYRYHSDPRAFVHDRERGNRIVVAGWALLRTTPATVRTAPHQVVSDVKEALARSA